MQYTKGQLVEILELHAKYLSGDNSGKRANLSGANLYGANLSGANLSGANLSGANLYGANLYGANLSGAYLYGAFLYGADLSGANLSGANLSGANLSGANLSGANLSGAIIEILEKIYRKNFCIVPEVGGFVGWKKINGHIIKLRIPKEASRVNYIASRKCRAEFAKVLAIFIIEDGKVTDKKTSRVVGGHDSNFVYEVGQIAKPDKFDGDFTKECTNGIHFFISKLEAEEY